MVANVSVSPRCQQSISQLLNVLLVSYICFVKLIRRLRLLPIFGFRKYFSCDMIHYFFIFAFLSPETPARIFPFFSCAFSFPFFDFANTSLDMIHYFFIFVFFLLQKLPQGYSTFFSLLQFLLSLQFVGFSTLL